ncbi:PDZ domain-containing protein [Clostridium sp. Marseille-Q7071]
MELLKYTLNQVSYAIVNPSHALVLVALSFIFYIQNKKTARIEYMIMGKNSTSAFELTVSQIVMGIFGGVIASILIVYLGVTFDINSNVYIIFMVSMILMIFNPRFICLSYSGAVLGIFSLIFALLSKMLDMPKLNIFNVNIVNLIALVGVMHFVEGILVILDGKRGSIPVFGNRKNTIVGGFAFKRYWALPLILLMVMGTAASNGGSQVATPNWWPILNHNVNKLLFETVVLGALPIYAVVGYNSSTFTRSKKEKTLFSGTLISIFGLVLIILSPLGNFGLVFQIALLLFMPFAHEAIAVFDRKKELKGKPIYVSNDEGIMILDVAPSSLGSEMGLKSGDMILEINDIKMINDEDIFQFMEQIPSTLWIKIKRRTGEIMEFTKNRIESGSRMGVVIVPRDFPNKKKIMKVEKSFEEILNKIKNKKNSDD